MEIDYALTITIENDLDIVIQQARISNRLVRSEENQLNKNRLLETLQSVSTHATNYNLNEPVAHNLSNFFPVILVRLASQSNEVFNTIGNVQKLRVDIYGVVINKTGYNLKIKTRTFENSKKNYQIIGEIHGWRQVRYIDFYAKNQACEKDDISADKDVADVGKAKAKNSRKKKTLIEESASPRPIEKTSTVTEDEHSNTTAIELLEIERQFASLDLKDSPDRKQVLASLRRLAQGG
ncbi:hypothetical protein MIR68_003690 [Amoeboaphelidium protococcarum]|nr:hypothetical protein MIR68_003690 [Amoeboaphelidium protococcarum]